MNPFEQQSLTLVAEGLKFPEGPVALSDGSVLVVEIEGGSVARVAPDGSLTRFPTAAGPNGMAIGPDGAAYVASDGGLLFEETEDGIRWPSNLAPDYVGGVIERLDIETGRIECLYDEVEGSHIQALNDVIFDTGGKAYVVDTAAGLIYYFDPAGGDIKVAARGLAAPNGMGLSPDGATLYVSETYTGKVVTMPVEGPGILGERQVLFSANGENGFDGLAIDSDGNICVANLAKSGITVISPDGERIGTVTVPQYDSFVTNICFGGEDMRTAWICSSGRGKLYSMCWPVAGLRLACNR